MSLYLRTLFISIILLWASIAFGQPTVLHLDKPYYTSGEVAWYKLYLPIEYKTLDAKVKLEITNSNGVIVDDHYLDAAGQGDITGYWNVPFSLASDQYTFSFIVNAHRQGASFTLASYEVPIYNDLIKLDKSTMKESISLSSPSVSSVGQLSIKTDKKIYSPRDKVSVEVQLTDKNGAAIAGECSVSITNMSLIGQGEVVKAIKASELRRLPQWTPSDKMVFNGVVMDTAGTALPINVLGMYSTSTQDMFLGKSDARGNYTLATKDFTGKMSVQALGYIISESDHIDIMANQEGAKSTSVLASSTVIDDYIMSSRLNKKIKQYYKTGEQMNFARTKNKVLERKPDADYDFSEYEPFPDLATFHNESNTSRLKFSINDNKVYEAVMYNPKGKKRNFKYPNPPTFIVDGKVTRDANLIGGIPFDEVSTVELYFRTQNIKKTFGTIGGSGYAIINTKTGDFDLRGEEEDDMIALNGLLRPADFVVGERRQSTDNSPVMSPLVYWNPEIPLEGGVAKFSFPQSDDIAMYIITVVARGADGSFSVKALPYEVRMTK